MYKEASEKILATPFDDEFWEDSFAIPGTKHLNEEDLLEDQENTQRGALCEIPVGCYPGLRFPGLIGAATGLAAVLLS